MVSKIPRNLIPSDSDSQPFSADSLYIYIYKVIFKCLSLEDSSAASATSSEFRQAEAEKKALEELMGKVPVTDFGEPTSLGSMNPGCGNSVIFNGYWTGPTFLCRSYNWIIWL